MLSYIYDTRVNARYNIRYYLEHCSFIINKYLYRNRGKSIHNILKEQLLTSGNTNQRGAGIMYGENHYQMRTGGKRGEYYFKQQITLYQTHRSTQRCFLMNGEF